MSTNNIDWEARAWELFKKYCGHYDENTSYETADRMVKYYKKSIESNQDRLYIRFGEIPSSGYSMKWKNGSPIGQELGVSVYDCIIDEYGRYRLIFPAELKTGQGETLENLINTVSQGHHRVENTREVYIVTGELVGHGDDGEPLLKGNTIKIIDNITSHVHK